MVKSYSLAESDFGLEGLLCDNRLICECLYFIGEMCCAEMGVIKKFFSLILHKLTFPSHEIALKAAVLKF